MTDDPTKERKLPMLPPVRRNLLIGSMIGIALVLAVTIWPTRYRYETKRRCVFNYGSPYINPDWGKAPRAKQFQRVVSSTINRESYRVDRITGEIFTPGQVPAQEGWKLIGLEYDSPGQFIEGDEFGGKANTGCRWAYLKSEQSDTPAGPWRAIETDTSGKPSPAPTKEPNEGAKGGAAPRVSKGESKKLAEAASRLERELDQVKAEVNAASQSRANLLSASNAYRESLEKLLKLQREDESRAAEIVGKRKELLALGVIDNRELEEGERALAEVQGKIAETTKRIAEVDQLVAEVNAAKKSKKGAK